MSSPEASGEESPGILARGPELVVGALLLVIGLIVMRDSIRVGIGWAEDGPRAGYFPFYIGLLLTIASTTVVIKQLLAWGKDRAVFAQRHELASVWSIAWPMLVYVVGVRLLGIYIASFLLITWFMKRHGDWSWLQVMAVAVGVPLVFFVVFEKWFLVLLPKGPFASLIGI